MISNKTATVADRLTTAAKAKQEMLERFRARPKADDPEMLAKQAERMAIAEARDARNAERRAAKEAEAARLAAEKAAEAERRRIQAAEEAAAAEAAAKRAAALPAEQKAARDARYAARQARRR
jgi:hypothetical protein